MAENINISFAPNKAASESQRIADLEQYVSTLTERTKFAFASIIEEYNGADTDKTQQILNTIYQSTSESGSDVGKFTTQWYSEIFNDYENNVATVPYSHAEGYRTSAKGLYSHAEGYSTVTSNDNAHAEGSGTEASGNTSHAEGSNTKATGWVSHAEGDSTIASGMYSHAEGGKSESKAKYSHAEGESTQATGYASHAEGGSCIASGNYSHAGGLSSEASGRCSYAGGELNIVSGDYSHAEGLSNTASGAYSHALGNGNTASGGCSIVGGVESKAKDPYAIAYGYKCVAGTNSMAIGSESEATNYSYAFGTGLKAYMQTVAFGMYNKETNARFVIGGGTADNPFDVLWIDSECNLHVAGKVIADGGVGYVLPTATADTLGGVRIGDNITVTDDGTISVDLSAYLKSADISDWAKQSDKPTYTANEIGLGNVDNTADADKPISTATQKALDGKADTGHTHTVSDITDMPAYLTEETDPTVPAWAKAESKPVYTAEEVGAVTAEDMDAKTYLKAVDITGQTVDLNDCKLNQPADKGKSVRHFCSVASSENITNRPVSVNEPFELVTTNIRYVSTGAYHTVQKYTSATRQRTYTRWCANGTWSAWKCDTDVVVYGSVTADSPKTFAYATYGEGFGVVEIEAYYDNATNPVRNRKVFALSPTASIERVMLTISNGSSESVTLANGSITMSMTGTTALSFMIRYTNSR